MLNELSVGDDIIFNWDICNNQKCTQTYTTVKEKLFMYFGYYPDKMRGQCLILSQLGYTGTYCCYPRIGDLREGKILNIDHDNNTIEVSWGKSVTGLMHGEPLGLFGSLMFSVDINGNGKAQLDSLPNYSNFTITDLFNQNKTYNINNHVKVYS